MDLPFDHDLTARVLQARLETIVRARVERMERARLRMQHAEQMAFPFGEMRECQEIMVDDIAGAAASGRTILCSAPTGTGKTVAALYPMVRETLRDNSRLFFVTSKVSQQELAIETLRKLLPAGCGALAVQVTARDRVCPSEDPRCVDKACPGMDGFFERLYASDILDGLLDRGVLDRASIEAIASEHRLCPFELSLVLAGYASVVVGDINYVFDPYVSLKRLLNDPYVRNRLVVDEAHNLVDRIRSTWSPEINIAELNESAKRCRGTGIDIYARAGEVMESFCDRFAEELLRYSEEQGNAPHFVSAPDRRYFERLNMDVESLIQDYYVYLAFQMERPPEFDLRYDPDRKRLADPLLHLLYELRHICACVCDLDSSLVAAIWYPDRRFKLQCLDTSGLTREKFSRFHSTVCMSATLAPFDVYQEMLGLDAGNILTLELTSPYPPENRLFLTVPDVDTTWRHRSASVKPIVSHIEKVMRLRVGNYIVFFPSFAYADEVMKEMNEDGYRIIRQTPGMETSGVLRGLEENLSETLLLCAVHGGVFSEGVDFTGHLAIGAFIVGPGLPALSVEQELIRQYHDQQGRPGFEFAYVHPGMTRVVQAGGRIIRRAEDRGFIMLLGRRFLEEPYAQKMPGYWSDEMTASTDPAALVERFWDPGLPA